MRGVICAGAPAQFWAGRPPTVRLVPVGPFPFIPISSTHAFLLHRRALSASPRVATRPSCRARVPTPTAAPPAPSRHNQLVSLAAHPSRLQHDLLWVPTSLSLTICNLTACLQQQSLARRRRSSLVATKNAVGGSKTKSPVPAKHTNTSRRRYRHSSKILDGSSKN